MVYDRALWHRPKRFDGRVELARHQEVALREVWEQV
jgi:hypothetical protein